ncbi:hypothetical protein FB567DRAFT_470286, partial [Paraphoma chrysanthemicola]
MEHELSPVALITGGASGLGLAVAKRLAELGWNLTIVDYSEKGEQIAKDLGEKTLFQKVNVASYDEQAKAFSDTYKKWGRLDFVFANAGILDRADFCAATDKNSDEPPPKPDTMVVDIDLTGVIWSSYLSLHYFRKNGPVGGKLAMTSSSAGIYVTSEVPLYAAAKHGIIGLARSLGKRMSETRENITVNAIVPGLVATGILPEDLVDSVPSQYRTPASLIVQAVENLINDATITGQVIECSGTDIVFR